MRSIDKFILHVVHNLFPLNEYSQGEMKFLMDKFKEEAEDLNIQVTDEQLKKYIERFDALKNNPKVTEKDLRKYSLSKLIQLVTSSPGAELPNEEEEDDTPDVVYSDNGITIWNGAKQGNCITYGASQKLPGGRKWCITEPGGSYFGTYRYGQSYGYPTFYLAKNDNLPDSNKLSFVSLQVLDDGTYKFTNRDNDPGMEGPFSWEELNRRVPWLRDIPNLKNILKYIPFSKSEKESEVYRNNPISIKQWTKEPFSTKKQYLQIRGKSRQLFSDISNELFISKYLPQYPEVANMVARTSGIIDVDLLIKYLDKFSKQEQSSIAQQIRDKVELRILKEDISFDLKKYLVKTNKVELDPNERLYVTKDNQSIVLLTFGDGSIKVGLYTDEDYYPDIKLNQRTSKYLLEYPELDKVPLRNLIKLAEDNVVSKEFIGDVLDKAKKDPNSALIIKPTEEGEIILDSNTFSSYKVEPDGKISSIPFDNEEVQQVLSDSKDNEALQQNALNLFKTKEDLPRNIDKRSLVSIINSIPYNSRIMSIPGVGSVILLANAETDRPFFLMNSNLTGPFYKVRGNYNAEGRFNSYGDVDENRVPAYHAYLRSINKSFSDAELMEIFRSTGIPIESKIAIVRNNMPVTTDTVYKPVMNNNDVVLINTRNSRESFMLSRSRNNLKQFNIPQQFANQLLGIAPEQPAAGAQPAAGGVARRGRPAGQPNAPQPAAAPAVAGDLALSTVANQYNLTPGFNNLPNNVLRKFRMNGGQIPAINNRGASARNNILGNTGRVTAVYEFGPSTVYIIRLANNTTVASIVVQPGNLHYIVTNNGSYPLGSPRELLQVLQRRNLAEIHQYLVNEYMGRNPEHLNEFKELLRKHINEKKNEQK